MTSPSDSIEHILPRSKASDKQKHRLGNLVLLPPNLNSRLQAKPPKEKTADYTRTGLLIAGRVASIITTHGSWSSKGIDAWEDELLLWAAKEWAD